MTLFNFDLGEEQFRRRIFLRFLRVLQTHSESQSKIHSLPDVEHCTWIGSLSRNGRLGNVQVCKVYVALTAGLTIMWTTQSAYERKGALPRLKMKWAYKTQNEANLPLNIFALQITKSDD